MRVPRLLRAATVGPPRAPRPPEARALGVRGVGGALLFGTGVGGPQLGWLPPPASLWVLGTSSVRPDLRIGAVLLECRPGPRAPGSWDALTAGSPDRGAPGPRPRCDRVGSALSGPGMQGRPPALGCRRRARAVLGFTCLSLHAAGLGAHEPGRRGDPRYFLPITREHFCHLWPFPVVLPSHTYTHTRAQRVASLRASRSLSYLEDRLVTASCKASSA